MTRQHHARFARRDGFGWGWFLAAICAYVIGPAAMVGFLIYLIWRMR